MKILKRILFISLAISIFFISKAYAANKVIVLDPGHGGSDTGAINSSAGIYERDINLKIATYLRNYLNEYAGVTVLMTHTGFSDGTLDLLARAMVGRNNHADMLISLHCNSTGSSVVAHGAEAYVTHNTSLPKYNEQCSKLAGMMLENLNKLGIKNRGVKTKLSGNEQEFYSDGTRSDYYGIIRASMKGVLEGDGANVQNGEGIPVVLMEHCFIQNGDEQYISSDEAISKLAKADCDAITQFFGLHLKEKSVSAITLEEQNKILTINDNLELNATIYPETAEDKTIIWNSSDDSVATVENGIVTGKSEGVATITATTNDGGYTATCKIGVKNLEIQTNIDEINCLQDEQISFKYKVSPYIPEGMELTIQIEDEDICEFADEEKSIITAKNSGETNIVLQLNKDGETVLEKKVEVNVNVLLENEKITINDLKEQNGILTRISAKTSLNDFLKNIEVSEGLEIFIEIPNIVDIEDETFITTNTKVNIKRRETEEIIKSYNCIIYGDIDQNGEITASDYGYIKNFIIGRDIIDISVIDAANVSRDEEITASDYGFIRNYIMKGTTLAIE